jgi:AcrR family transcriptional regulator
MAPTKGELTRERILAAAAPLFNRLGYAGASMADLMAAAGLEKGGIYRHFASKKAVAVAAFDHAVRLHNARIRAYLASAPADAASRLIAVAEGLASAADDPAIDGGCPLLNTAVESDDAEGPLYPALRAHTRRAMAQLLGTVRGIVAEGVASGEFRATTDVHAEASGIVAAMEGALMLTKLYNDPVHLEHALERVRERTKVLAGCAG